MKLVGFWLGLAVVAFVGGGVAAGCTGDHDTRVIPPEEGGPPREGGPGTTPGATCPSDLPIDPKDLVWKAPRSPQEGKCQDDDIVAMKDYLAANPSASNEDFENFVKNRDATCHDCIFADADGATWSPAPVRGGKVVTFNVGACFAILGSEACGATVQNAWDCEFEACALCEAPSAVASCREKSRTGICRPYEDRAKTECVNLAVDEVCGTPLDSIRVQCVRKTAPVPEAGDDGGQDAGTD
ncbi:MAG: hypothetical protein JWP87_2344 [Labilithrix sp.]|nr:hypothetical protein [Labilithrix sp.]